MTTTSRIVWPPPRLPWWNGGLRTTAYFQNIIGLLTEIIGNPTPMEIPFVPQRQLPSNDYPFPITPQRWHMKQSIEYEITADRAVLDVASRNRDTLLYNFYTMGRNQIARGSTDTWTSTPKTVDELLDMYCLSAERVAQRVQKLMASDVPVTSCE